MTTADQAKTIHRHPANNPRFDTYRSSSFRRPAQSKPAIATSTPTTTTTPTTATAAVRLSGLPPLLLLRRLCRLLSRRGDKDVTHHPFGGETLTGAQRQQADQEVVGCRLDVDADGAMEAVAVAAEAPDLVVLVVLIQAGKGVAQALVSHNPKDLVELIDLDRLAIQVPATALGPPSTALAAAAAAAAATTSVYLLAAEQRLRVEELAQNASDRPHVDRRRLVALSQQQLGRPVPEGHHHRRRG